MADAQQNGSTLGRPIGGGRSADENRAYILDAAERCFARAGIDDTTVQDIAAEADISRSLLYRHFSSRDEIVLACIERAGNRLMSAAAKAYVGAESLAELLTELLVEVAWLARNDPLLTGAFGGRDRQVATSLISESDVMLGDPGAFEATLRELRPDFLDQLRDGLGFTEALEYVRTFGLVLVTAPKKVAGTRRGIRRYVETFLLPAIVRNPPPVT